MRTRWIETSIHAGATVEHGLYTATPQSWSLTAAWPGGGWVWNRPRAVIVEKEETQERIPIHNVTLLVQIALSVLVLIAGLAFAVPFAIKSSNRRK